MFGFGAAGVVADVVEGFVVVPGCVCVEVDGGGLVGAGEAAGCPGAAVDGDGLAVCGVGESVVFGSSPANAIPDDNPMLATSTLK